MKDHIAVLIPCYNESRTIEKVVRDFRRVLPEAVVYVYDNNSSDGTGDIAARAGAVVRKERMQGKGNVIRRMFREIDADCYLMEMTLIPRRMRRQWWRLFLMSKRIWLLEIGCPAPILRRINDLFIIWGTGLCAHPSIVCLEVMLKIS